VTPVDPKPYIAWPWNCEDETMDVGILGLGNISQRRHLPAFANSDYARIVGVHDRNEERTRRVAREHDVPATERVTDLYEAAEMVVVCTPPWTHHELTIEALERDCDVFTEKPIAMSHDQAAEMVETAERRGRTLTVVNNFRYLDSVTGVRRLVDAGRLGEIVRTHAVQLRQFDHDDHGREWFTRLPGGMFWDESPHMVYLTRTFIDTVTVESAKATAREGPNQRHNVRAEFSGASGATGTLTMNFDSPITEWWFVVVGTDGIAFVDLFRDIALSFDRESDHSARRVLEVVLKATAQAAYGTITSGLDLLYDRIVEGYEVPDAGLSRQVERTFRALERGEAPPVSARANATDVRAMEEVTERAGLVD